MVDLANAFAQRGCAVDLVVLQRVGEYTSQVDPRVSLVSLDARRMVLSLPAFIRYMRAARPAVIVANDEHAHLYSTLAVKLSRTPTRIVLRVGSMFTELLGEYHGLKRLRLKFILTCIYPHADAFVAVSKGVADDLLASSRARAECIHTIYNPKSLREIEAKAQEPVSHPWMLQKDIPVLITASRLRVRKNIQLLIRAFARLRKDVPAYLVIVGRGREEGMLRALAHELECDDFVFFTGYQENPYAWMARSTLFVFPTLWEGMPNALVEAMICGLPVVSSDCTSGPREILAPDTDYKKRLASGVEYATYGVLCAVNDEEALVEALNKLLTDEALRKKYAQASRERAKDFDAEDIIDEYARVLGV